jgi:hypothetical protein
MLTGNVQPLPVDILIIKVNVNVRNYLILERLTCISGSEINLNTLCQKYIEEICHNIYRAILVKRNKCTNKVK